MRFYVENRIPDLYGGSYEVTVAIISGTLEYTEKLEGIVEECSGTGILTIS